MKRILTAIILSLVTVLSLRATDETTFKNAYATATWTQVGSSAVWYTHLTFSSDSQIFSSSQQIHIVRYPIGSMTSLLVANEGKANATKLSSAATAVGATAAINGSYFDNANTDSNSYRTTAVPMWYAATEYNFEDLLVISDSEYALNQKRCNGYVAFKDGDITIGSASYADWQSAGTSYWSDLKSSSDQFIVSGPLLMLDGSAQPSTTDGYWTGRHPRSIIAKDDVYTYLISVDGRNADAGREGVTMPEAQSILSWIGVTDALNLDGGGSSEIWLDAKGVGDFSVDGVLNHPSDGSERTEPTLIAAVPKTADGSWTSYAAASFAGGSGTESDPYRIATASQLALLSKNISSYKSSYFILTADIDLSSHYWVPISATGNNFLGSFDGQSHTISGMKVSTDAMYAGLFGLIGDDSHQVVIRDFTIQGSVETSASLSDDNQGVGGVIGKCFGALIGDIICEVDITKASGKGKVAGIVGNAYANTASYPCVINRCRYSGNIRVDAYDCIGGIVGYTKVSAVSDCLFDGSISAGSGSTTSNVGGILGYVNNASFIGVSNCLSIGSLVNNSSTAITGAVVGREGSSVSSTKDSNNYYKSGIASKAYGQLNSGSNTPTASAIEAGASDWTDGTLLAGLGSEWVQSEEYPIPNSSKSIVIYYTYSIVWEGAPEDALAKIYGYAVTPDEAYVTIPKSALADSDITVADVVGYDASLSIDNSTRTITITYAVHAHQYNSNGFCTTCGEGQPCAEGDGSASNPYKIANGGNLYWFAAQVNSVSGALCAELAADISLDGCSWIPIGSDGQPFSGTFNGNGHTISGLTLEASTVDAGLFGFVYGATIKNFTLNGAISAPQTISSTASSDTTSVNVSRLGTVAGTAGGNALIEDVTSNVDITVASSAVWKQVGGIIGGCEVDKTKTAKDNGYTTKTVTVNRCRYSGTLTSGGSDDCIGGIAGYFSDNKITMSNCLFDGAIRGTSGKGLVGGLFGFTASSAKVVSCLVYPKEQITGGALQDGTPKRGLIAGRYNYATTGISGVWYVKSSDDDTVIGYNEKSTEFTPENFAEASGASLTDGTLVATLGTFNWTQGTDRPVPYPGTETDTDGATWYNIATPELLRSFRDLVNGAAVSGKSMTSSINGRLTADIDLGGEDFGAPIAPGVIVSAVGDDGNFSGTRILYGGTFDGQGHSITGLSISGDYQANGLFGWVYNATLKDFSVSGTIKYTGTDTKVGKAWYGSSTSTRLCLGTVAFVEGANSLVSGISSSIDFDVADFTISQADDQGRKDVMPCDFGGIAGILAAGKVEKCRWNGTMGTSEAARMISDCLGGIVGYSAGNTTISECVFAGSITNTNTYDVQASSSGIDGGARTNMLTYLGGILGYINADGSVQEYNSSEGTVNGSTAAFTGALVGIDRMPTQMAYNFYPASTNAVGAGNSSVSSTSASQLTEIEVVATGIDGNDIILDHYVYSDTLARTFFPASMASKNVSIKKITFTRSQKYVRKNAWMSVCMPFALSKANLPSTSQLSAEIYVVDKVDSDGLHLTYADNVAAGTPCFIYVTGTGDGEDLGSDWTIVLEDESGTPVVLSPAESSEVFGSFDQALIGAGCYKLDEEGAALYVTTSEGKTFPFRAYIVPSEPVTKTMSIIADGVEKAVATIPEVFDAD